MPLDNTIKRDNYLKNLFEVEHIDDIPNPKEVVEEVLDDNLKGLKEGGKADYCFRCGSEENLIITLPKVKKERRGYRHFETFKGVLYKICLDQYGDPVQPKDLQKFDKYILRNWGDILKVFEKELEAFKDRYRSPEEFITVCEKCNTIINNYNLYLCSSCEEELHPAKYDKCWDCTKKEEGLKLCPSCNKKYYNPSKNDSCRICNRDY